MSKPVTPSPRYRYWFYYIALAILLIAAAVWLAMKLYSKWE